MNVIGPSRYKVNKKALRKFMSELVVKHQADPQGDLNVIFVGSRKMREIATTYKDEDVALPVLAFPYTDDKEGNIIGEIVICYPQAVLLAAERGKKIEEMMKQLIEHGLRNIVAHSRT